MKSIYKITLLFLFIPLICFGNTDKKKHEKKKVIKKIFTVKANARVSLDNKYGNLYITTWDKNRVEIEVEIIVKGDDLEDVENKLASIDVRFNAEASFVDAKTVFNENNKRWSWWKRNDNINYQINYIVKMPVSNSVNLDNDYGSVFLDKLSGNADINCDYGKISIDELTASDNQINLDYCSSSSIGYIKGGDLNIDYSKLTIEDSKTIKLNADYSTFKCNKIETIHFNVDYGGITINEANNIEGNADYTSLRFGTIRNDLEIDINYGSLRVAKLAKTFENVDIIGEYTGIKIGIESDTSFDFIVDLQYAGFKRNNDDIEFFKSISKSSKKYYEGKFGKGKTTSKIKIKSQYGGVSFKESF